MRNGYITGSNCTQKNKNKYQINSKLHDIYEII